MGILTSRHKIATHVALLFLIIIVIGFSVPRYFLDADTEKLKQSTLGVTMGAKSLIIVLYQLLSETVSSFRRWASPIAYLILNTLETLFWAGVAFFVLSANIELCHGIDCALGWAVVSVSILISLLSGYAAVISYLDYQFYRRTGKHRASDTQSLEEGLIL
ncbi:hypothetical protein BJX76DRAFT_358499 [Aspergillus varians]